jgi:Holliday junction resolvase RusA-like endonuclease
MRQEFFIKTIPAGQARPRFTNIGGFIKSYDPKGSKGYKLDIKYQVMAQKPKMIEGPIAMVIEFFMPRIKAHYNKKGLKQDAPTYHEKKPDVDNLIKAVLDGLTGILWKDDTQISVLTASKKYSEKTGIQICVEEVR